MATQKEVNVPFGFTSLKVEHRVKDQVMHSEAKVKIRVELRSYLASINVTPYALGKWVKGISPQTIYAVASGTRRPSLEVLEAILIGLHVNGYQTTLNDIIRVETLEDGDIS